MSTFLVMHIIETTNGQKFYYNYEDCNNPKEALCKYAKGATLKRKYRSFLRESSSLNAQETFDLLNNKYLFDKDKIEKVVKVDAKTI